MIYDTVLPLKSAVTGACIDEGTHCIRYHLTLTE